MKKNFFLCLGSMILFHSVASAAVVSVTSFLVTGSNYNPLTPFFDAQPLTDPIAGSTATTIGSEFGGWFNATQRGGFDFGTSFASKTFTDVYLLQGGFQVTNMVATYWWSTDTALDGGDVAAPNLNLMNYNDGLGSNTTGKWNLQYQNGAGVTPLAQYLIVQYVSGNTGNRNFEIAFVNAAAVPEPTSMLLLTGGAVALVLIRRRRNV